MLKSAWAYRKWILAVIAAAAITGYFIWMPLSRHTQYQAEAESRRGIYDQTAQEIIEACSIFPIDSQLECLSERISGAQENYRGENDLAAQRTMAVWTAAIGIVAIIGIPLTSLGITLIFVTFQETRKGAQAAADQIELMMISQRPSLHLSRVWAVSEIAPNKSQTIEAPPVPEVVTAMLTIRSGGPTHCTIIDGRYGYCVADDLPAQPEYPNELGFRPGAMLAARGYILPEPSVLLTFDARQRASLDNGAARIWLWAYVILKDALGGKVTFRCACSWGREPYVDGDDLYNLGRGWWEKKGNSPYVGEDYEPPLKRAS